MFCRCSISMNLLPSDCSTFEVEVLFEVIGMRKVEAGKWLTPKAVERMRFF